MIPSKVKSGHKCIEDPYTNHILLIQITKTLFSFPQTFSHDPEGNNLP